MRQTSNFSNDALPASAKWLRFLESPLVVPADARCAFRHGSLPKLGSFTAFSQPHAGRPAQIGFVPSFLVRFTRERLRMGSFRQLPFLAQLLAPVADAPTGSPENWVRSFILRCPLPPTAANWLRFRLSVFPRVRRSPRSPIGVVSTKPPSRFCYNDSFRPDIAGSRYVP